MPKYALCAELKEGCRDQYIEMHHHATVTQRLRDINRKAGVTKEQVICTATYFASLLILLLCILRCLTRFPRVPLNCCRSSCSVI